MFVRCIKLKNFTITKSTTELIGGCFNYCESLTQITYDGGRIICGQCGDKFKRQTYTSSITWACKTHLFHKSDCSMKYIHDDAVRAAFVTMMNKLIFARKLMLRPLCEALRIAGSDENLQRILHLKEELQHNAERKDELRKLRARGIIDSILYNQEVSRIEKQSDEFRAEIKGLGNAESESSLREAEHLLKYVESADMLSDLEVHPARSSPQINGGIQNLPCRIIFTPFKIRKCLKSPYRYSEQFQASDILQMLVHRQLSQMLS